MKCSLCDNTNAKPDVEYEDLLLCPSCSDLYYARALRPDMWFKAARLIGPNAFPLNDDFYNDETGMPYQPSIQIDESYYEKFQIDRETIAKTAKGFLDDLLTRHILWDHDRVIIPDSYYQYCQETLQKIIDNSSVIEFIDSAYQILSWQKPNDWILSLVKRKWLKHYEMHWFGISKALIAHSQQEESLSMVGDALNTINAEHVSDYLGVLSGYSNECAIPLLRRIIITRKLPLLDKLGFYYRFLNPSWKTIKQDIQSGRPMSIVAIDSLWVEHGNQYKLMLSRLNLLPLVINKHEAKELLSDYHQKDRVPRVRKAIEYVMELYEL